MQITVVSTSSVEAINKITIYPNPTNGILNINQDRLGRLNIQIFDNTGKQVRSFTTEEYENRIDLSPLPNGLYFISVQNHQQIKTFKIIKQ